MQQKSGYESAFLSKNQNRNYALTEILPATVYSGFNL